MNQLQGSSEGDAVAPVKKRSGLRAAVIGILLGGALSLLALIGWLAIFQRDTMPPLTEAAYQAALEKWNQRGPADYDLEIAISGNRPGQVRLEVRNGEAVAMTRDGVSPKQPRVWQYWTVPGQFEMLREELDHAQDPQGAYGGAGPIQVELAAEFDPQLGYPRKFQRTVYGQDQTMRWEVTKFTER